MGRPSRLGEKRQQFLPIIARTFADLGYRRTTTSELASRCGVQETVLYRIWPGGKKAMFLAAIEYVYDASAEIWQQLIAGEDPAQTAIEYESSHHGHMRLYRIVFAGLNEVDDPDIRAALRHMYEQFQQFIVAQLSRRRSAGQQGGAAGAGRPKQAAPAGAGQIPPDLAAWAIVGIGTVSSIARELELITDDKRRSMFRQAARLLMDSAQ